MKPILFIGALLGVTAAAVVSSVFGARSVLIRQAAVAQRRIGNPLGEIALNADRIWRKSLGGDPIHLLVLGDSLAAGLGAKRRKETLGGRIARGLAHEVGFPVLLRTAAVVGSESSKLTQQLKSLPKDYQADVAVIVVGANDVLNRVPMNDATRSLEDAIERLQEAGTPVVVGTCPDLGTLKPVPQPLRALLSRMSRRMAAAQTRAAVRAGAETVSLRRTVGPVFRASPSEMFSLDQFHPSAAGYRRAADVLLPAVVKAVRQVRAASEHEHPERIVHGALGDGS